MDDSHHAVCLITDSEIVYHQRCSRPRGEDADGKTKCLGLLTPDKLTSDGASCSASGACWVEQLSVEQRTEQGKPQVYKQAHKQTSWTNNMIISYSNIQASVSPSYLHIFVLSGNPPITGSWWVHAWTKSDDTKACSLKTLDWIWEKIDGSKLSHKIKPQLSMLKDKLDLISAHHWWAESVRNQNTLSRENQETQHHWL